MLKKRLILLVFFLLFLWLALATRSHSEWFYPLVATYGGDIMWAAMFLFLLRIFFSSTSLTTLAFINFSLGVADEVQQIYQADWIQALRNTRIGGLILGHGFLWSDLLCYAIGTIIAYVIILFIDKLTTTTIHQYNSYR